MARHVGGSAVIDFDHPDETRKVPHGHIDIVRVEEFTIAQITLEPGWHSTVEMKLIVDADRCPIRRVGYTISGGMRSIVSDGIEEELGPGMAYVIELGHDAIVLGSEPAVSLEYSTKAAKALTGKTA